MPRIIQIIPECDTESTTILYGLDEYGGIWAFRYTTNGYVWEALEVKV